MAIEKNTPPEYYYEIKIIWFQKLKLNFIEVKIFITNKNTSEIILPENSYL